MDRPRELLRAVESVRDQTYEPIELVVIEEGVTEPQVPALLADAGFDSTEFRHVFNEEPTGVEVARNQAVAHSSGEYLAFLDDDDEWYPTKIEKQLSRIRETGCDVCYTGAERRGPDGDLRATAIPDVEGDARSRTLAGAIIGPSVFVVSRDGFETVGGFDEEIPFWEDWDFLYRLSERYRFTGVHEPLAKIHTDADVRRSDAPDLAERGGRYLIDKHCPIDHERQRFATRRFKSRVWNGVGRSALMNGRYSDARAFFARAVLEWPFDRSLLLYGALSYGGDPVLQTAQTVKRGVVGMVHD